jgi:putative hemolysin
MTPDLLAQVAPRFEVSGIEAVAGFVVVFSLMVLNALYHAAEAAITNIRSARLRDLSEAKDSRAASLQDISSNANTYFAACQIGTHACRVGMYVAGGMTSPWLAQLLTGRPNYGVGTLIGSTVVIVFFIALVNLSFVELFFRGLGRKSPEVWAYRLYSFMKGSSVALAPLVWLVSGISRLFTKRLGINALFSPPIVTEEDLREMVEAGSESGELIEDEKDMIHSIIEFTDTVAREVMTPRTDIDAIEATATVAEVAQLINDSGHTRIPIYQGTIDRIIGVVHAKDVLKCLLDKNGQDLRTIMRPALFIPESKDLHQLLAEFRRARSLMAIVQDEFGGTAGLVTIEDLVEEIVGEIVDEYDVEEPEVQPVGEGEWLVDGRMHVDDVNHEIGSQFESDEFDTLGGYVFGLFGRQPSKGEAIEVDDWDLGVAETDGRRVMRVLVRRRERVG